MPTDTRIIVQGCEEATVVTLALTADEVAVVERVAEASRGMATSDCHPYIEVV